MSRRGFLMHFNGAVFISLLLLCCVRWAASADVTVNLDVLEQCSAVAPYCQWSNTSIWANGALPGPNDNVIIDFSTSTSYNIIRMATDVEVSVNSLFVHGKNAYIQLDITKRFQVATNIDGRRFHFSVHSQLNASTVTLERGEVLVSSDGRFYVSDSIIFNSGTVQLGAKEDVYFSFHNVTNYDANIFIQTNGIMKYYTQFSGSLSITGSLIVEAKQWNLFRAVIKTSFDSAISSLESLEALQTSLDLRGDFIALAPVPSFTFKESFGRVAHRLHRPSQPLISFIAGKVTLETAALSATSNVSLIGAAAVTIASPPRTTAGILPANIDVFDYSNIVIWLNDTVSVFGSLTYRDNSGRLTLQGIGSASSRTSLTITKTLSLNQTRLTVDNIRPEQTPVRVASYETLQGQFNDVISLKNIDNHYDVFVTQFYYYEGGVSFYFHAQMWPGVGWGMLPISLLVAAIFVVVVVFAARRIAFARGENDVSVFSGGFSRV